MHNPIQSIDDVIRDKNLAYAERNLCAISIAKLAKKMGYKVYVAEYSDDEIQAMNHDKAWKTTLIVHLPTGQVSWNLHCSELYMTREFEKTHNYVIENTSAAEKYARLTGWVDKLERHTDKSSRFFRRSSSSVQFPE